jgi:hypothetical protein
MGGRLKIEVAILCENCKNKVIKTSNNQKYCSPCKKVCYRLTPEENKKNNDAYYRIHKKEIIRKKLQVRALNTKQYKKQAKIWYENYKISLREKMTSVSSLEIKKPKGRFAPFSGWPDGAMGQAFVEMKRGLDVVRKNQAQTHERLFKIMGFYPIIMYIDFVEKTHWFSNYKDFNNFRRVKG